MEVVPAKSGRSSTILVEMECVGAPLRRSWPYARGFCYSDRTMIAAHVGQILIVTGLLTIGAIAFFLMPAAMLKLVFGVAETDLATRTIARHWGLLVALVGALLVLAGHHPEVRVPVMVVAATEKLAIATLVLSSTLRQRSLPLMIASSDAVMAILYLIALS